MTYTVPWGPVIGEGDMPGHCVHAMRVAAERLHRSGLSFEEALESPERVMPEEPRGYILALAFAAEFGLLAAN